MKRLVSHKEVAKYICPGSTVVVGCSGGKDSKTATGVLLDLNATLNLNIIIVYINHGLRSESDTEVDLVRTWAASLGLAYRHVKLQLRTSSEEEARRARRQALLAIAKEVGASVVVLGHTAQDQVETLLMRMIRGTGLRGLCGMHEWVPGPISIYRPLLKIKQTDILAYVAAKGWSIVQDSSNNTDKYFRNRCRHHLLPFMLSENKQVENACSALTEILQKDEEGLQFFVNQAWDKAILSDGVLDRSSIVYYPDAILRRLVMRLWHQHQAQTDKQIKYDQVCTATRLIKKGKGSLCLSKSKLLVTKNIVQILS